MRIPELTVSSRIAFDAAAGRPLTAPAVVGRMTKTSRATLDIGRGLRYAVQIGTTDGPDVKRSPGAVAKALHDRGRVSANEGGPSRMDAGMLR